MGFFAYILTRLEIIRQRSDEVRKIWMNRPCRDKGSRIQQCSFFLKTFKIFYFARRVQDFNNAHLIFLCAYNNGRAVVPYLTNSIKSPAIPCSEKWPRWWICKGHAKWEHCLIVRCKKRKSWPFDFTQMITIESYLKVR